jgi:dienelactone hydrolase
MRRGNDSVRRLGTSVAVVVALGALLLAGCDWKGPDPTPTSVSGNGPFAYETIVVPAGSGFGGGTIYAPTDLTQGLYGGVALAPGFTERQNVVQWYGPLLASNGFVVITIDTLGLYDLPPARGDQLIAALTYLTTTSAVASRVDPNRLAVMGHSMGGGGSLEAAKKKPALRAAIPLAPWDQTQDWSGNVTPTLIVACQNDSIAPVANHATPFYNSLTSEKAYLELAGVDHACPSSTNATIATYALSWLKRWVDGDTRYTQFLCPPPATGSVISKFEATCPY